MTHHRAVSIPTLCGINDSTNTLHKDLHNTHTLNTTHKDGSTHPMEQAHQKTFTPNVINQIMKIPIKAPLKL